MVKQQDQVQLQIGQLSIYTLYDAYAGMLLGYIFEVVKDQKIAEDYLVKTFKAVAAKFNDIPWTENNNWHHLQLFAKNELSAFNEVAKAYETPSASNATGGLPNKYTDRMTKEQKLVFCNIYYSKKSVAQLAKEINQTQQHVKTVLKEAFAIIRRSHGN